MRSAARLVWLALVLAAATPALAQERQLVVRQLKFEGNEAIPGEILAAAIATTNSSWFARSIPFRWVGLGRQALLR